MKFIDVNASHLEPGADLSQARGGPGCRYFKLLDATFGSASRGAIFIIPDIENNTHVFMKIDNRGNNCLDLATAEAGYYPIDQRIRLIPHHLIPRYFDSLGREFLSEED